MRVSLKKRLCDELPKGSLGTAMYLKDGILPKSGLIRVQWDNGMSVPMRRGEIQPVEPRLPCPEQAR